MRAFRSRSFIPSFSRKFKMSANSDQQMSVLDRAWTQIARAVRGFGSKKNTEELVLKPSITKSDEAKLIEAFSECIEHRGGEVRARARAATLGQAYLRLSNDGRRRFLQILAQDFDIDRNNINKLMDSVREAKDADARIKAEKSLKKALVPPRVEVLRQFNALPNGAKFLVDLRADLLVWQRETPLFAGLQEDLKSLLANWFDIGFLELKQIDWSASAQLLEKLIQYEAVHRIRSWDDLKKRLEFDRRCYAFFHPRMPNEPLIFVEVALVNGIAGDVGKLLDESRTAIDPSLADTAIFYSISNAQAGLAGISFGDFLIKRVVASLSNELPNIKTFATLSPIPGLRKWMKKPSEIAKGIPLSNDQVDVLKDFVQKRGGAQEKAVGDVNSATEEIDASNKIALIEAALSIPEWHKKPDIVQILKPSLICLAANYLGMCKREDGRALDPVAHFHLSNGARMERLNWAADLSENGLRQSAGLMINYLYRLPEIDENHEAYSAPDRRIIMSSAVKSAATIGK